MITKALGGGVGEKKREKLVKFQNILNFKMWWNFEHFEVQDIFDLFYWTQHKGLLDMKNADF